MSEKLSNFRIGVTYGMSGYFAVMLVDVEDEDGKYTDIQQTGVGRYKNKNKAIAEGEEWAKSEEIPFIN